MTARRLRGCAPLVLALGAARAVAAVRAHLGGTLLVGLVGLVPPAADSPADSPEALSARALLALPLCRLLPGPTPLLVRTVRAGPGGAEEVQLWPLPEARFVDGSPLGVRDVSASWQRLVDLYTPLIQTWLRRQGWISVRENHQTKVSTNSNGFFSQN